MTQEQKAKRYDELIAKLIKAKEDDMLNDERYCCVIDEIVPELAESEDERIREEILGFLKTNNAWNKEWVAWLENQVEQKPNPCNGCVNRKGCINYENSELKETELKSDNVEPKFHKGQWIVRAR